MDVPDNLPPWHRALMLLLSHLLFNSHATSLQRKGIPFTHLDPPTLLLYSVKASGAPDKGTVGNIGVL